MSEKHSPGPWTWRDACLIAADDAIVLREDGDVDETTADARLIAAAPEMLGLLNKARHIGSIGYCPWCSEWNGHFTSCELVALLARIDGELTP